MDRRVGEHLAQHRLGRIGRMIGQQPAIHRGPRELRQRIVGMAPEQPRRHARRTHLGVVPGRYRRQPPRRGSVARLRHCAQVRRDGRQLVYRARVDESQVRRSMVGDLIQTLFRGDPNALLAHLVSEKEVAPGDLERVQALLAKPAKDRP